jgi:CheY-like chemotaxis protein
MVTVGAQGVQAYGLAPGPYVRLAVRDTGHGMPEEVRVRAFEPFYTTKGPGKGTGLGLSMLFGLASLAGGTATLESEPGKGTTVTVFLPQATALIPAPDSQPAPAVGAEPEPRRQERRRVLLVDDDDTVRAIGAEMLRELGCAVEEARSGQQALAIVSADQQFDLLMLDFAMPDMNGSRLAAEVRKTWPDAPLLFVTGYVENDALRTWTELGVPTLSKPFTEEALASAVALALERRAASASVIPLRA